MSFTSLDDLLSEIAAGKNSRWDFNKITGLAGYATGRWYDMGALAGSPVANLFPGTALAWQSCNESTGNGTQAFGIPHGGNVSPDSKHAINVMGVTSVGTFVPSVLMLVDIQGYWPGISVNTLSAQTLTGTPTIRYTNGAGLRLYSVITTTAGASAHNINLSYTNQAGTTGRTLPGTVACTSSAIPPHIHHAGAAANNFGPFLPLASGDSGVQNVASVTFSAASGAAGVASLCLVKPLLTLPIATVSIASERDLVNQLPSMPQIKDGACLQWLVFAGGAVAASSSMYGSIEFAWG